MKIFLLAVVFFISGCTTFNSSSHFETRDYAEYKMSNGLKVLLIEDKSLPYFSLNLLIGSGSSSNTLEKAGLANFVGELLLKGTRDKSALTIADEIGQMGADFDVSVADDYTVVSASSLSFSKEKLLNLFSEVLLQPAFSKTEISRLKENTTARIKKQVDHPSYFASQAFSSFLYENHPYALPPVGTVKSVRSIRQKDINRFYLRHYRPDNATLAVVGHFGEEIRELLEKGFSTWKPGKNSELQFPEFPPIEGKMIRLVHKSGLSQSQIRLGFKGIKRKNKDYLALRLANTILGGAFASRLSDHVRKKLGLTYGISSSFLAKKDNGPFTISTFSRNEKVGEAISETIKIVDEFYKKGVSAEEVKQAKGLMMGQFPRAIETAEKLAFNLLVMRFYGVEDSYLSDFIDNVEAMSVAEVNRVIRKYFNPENIKVLVYSDQRKVLSQLKELGKVEMTKL